MKRGRGWWGIIWPIGAIALIGLSFGYMLVRGVWDFDTIFVDQLKGKGYPEAIVDKGTTSMGPGKSQQLYIARVQVGTCLLRLDRAQYDNDFHLKEVNGQAVDDPDDSPSKQQALTFLSGKNIFCSR
jgi:hypothetical protein